MVDKRGRPGTEWRFRKLNGRWQRRHPDGGPWQELQVIRPPAQEPLTSLRGTRPRGPQPNEWRWNDTTTH